MDITTALIADSLSAHDRCDSCGSQAYVQVFMSEGDLLFCSHHYKKNQDLLMSTAKHIHDESHKLMPASSSNNDVE